MIILNALFTLDQPYGGPMGPQDIKWKSMYYETANKTQEKPKIDQLKHKFEEHLAQSMPQENFQTTGYGMGSSDQYREIKRQNDFLKHYSLFIFFFITLKKNLKMKNS